MGRPSKSAEALRLATYLGRVLRIVRRHRGVKAESMAYDLGLSQQAISHIECGKVVVTLGTLLRICAYLNLPMSAVFVHAEKLQQRDRVFTVSAQTIRQYEATA